MAQLGGCLTQPGARCMGSQSKGYFVHVFRFINSTWPHASHLFYNGAIDATPAHIFRNCLYGLLPPSPDLIFLEFGSMARHIDLPLTELLVRELLSLPSSPALVFFTVREWCSAAHLPHFLKKHPGMEPPDYGPAVETPHSRAEAAFEVMCKAYDVSCLSYHHAIGPLYFQRAPNFTRPDVAPDYLGRRRGVVVTSS